MDEVFATLSRLRVQVQPPVPFLPPPRATAPLPQPILSPKSESHCSYVPGSATVVPFPREIFVRTFCVERASTPRSTASDHCWRPKLSPGRRVLPHLFEAPGHAPATLLKLLVVSPADVLRPAGPEVRPRPAAQLPRVPRLLDPLLLPRPGPQLHHQARVDRVAQLSHRGKTRTPVSVNTRPVRS